MGKASTPCVRCGVIGQCPCEARRRGAARAANVDLQARRRARYGAAWAATSRRAVAAHVAVHGWWCPGWRIDAHVSSDLTLDHERGILCRSCNARKRVVDNE